MSAKLDGSDIQLITSDLYIPSGIDIHDDYIYFTANNGRLYKQSKSPGSSKIQLNFDIQNMRGVKVYQKDMRTYNVMKLVIRSLLSSFQIQALYIYS